MRHLIDRVVELTDGPVVLHSLADNKMLVVQKGDRLILVDLNQELHAQLTTVVFRVNGEVYKTEMDFPDILLTEV